MTYTFIIIWLIFTLAIVVAAFQASVPLGAGLLIYLFVLGVLIVRGPRPSAPPASPKRRKARGWDGYEEYY